MKSRINTKKISLTALAVTLIMIVSIFVWERYIESPLTNWFEGEPIVMQRIEKAPTEFELWKAGADVQAMLQNEFNKHKRDALNKEITEYESKR